MNKKKLTAVMLALLLLLGLLAGCGRAVNGAKASQSAEIAMEMPSEPAAAYGAGFYTADAKMDYPVAEAEEAYDYASNTSGAPINMVSNLTYGENVKLIFRAYMHLQTLDFAQAEAELNRMVEKYGGYFESVYTDNGSYYSNYNYLSGSYTVRVPAANYDKFLTEAGNACHVVNLNKTTEDVGLQYSDTQMRLQTEKTKQERLLTLLSQATEMEDIISLENAISDCQYTIDSLTSTINRYDSLIGFSTVQIELEQVQRLDNSIVEEPTFWERLSRDFKEGLEDFVYGVEEFVLWAAYHLLGIIIFIVVVIVIVKLLKRVFSGKKIRLPKKGKKQEETVEAPVDEAGLPEQVQDENR